MSEKKDIKAALKEKIEEKIDGFDIEELEDADLEDVAGGGNNNCFCFQD